MTKSGQSIHWYELGSVSDIPLQGSRRVIINEQTIALFRTGTDKVFAIEDKCPHKQGPLSEGIVHDNCVTCPLHNWVINLESGIAQGPDEGAVATYPVAIEGDQLRVAVIRRDKSVLASTAD